MRFIVKLIGGAALKCATVPESPFYILCFLEAMKIVHHHANGRFDWLISEHQSVNAWKEAIFVLSGKYERFTFVHPVPSYTIQYAIILSYDF